MKQHYALPATLIAGLTIGAILSSALKAQGTPPAYVVAEVAVHDADGFARTTAQRLQEHCNHMVADFSPRAR